MPTLEYWIAHSFMHSLAVVSPCVLEASASHCSWHFERILLLQHVVASPRPAPRTASMHFVKQSGSWPSLSHTWVHDDPYVP